MEYKEPQIVFGKERYGRRVARLSNGGMCIDEKAYKPRRKSWKWEAVKCEPHVFDLEDVDTGKVESFVLGYKQKKGMDGHKEYGKTRKEAVLYCLIEYWT